MRNPRLFEAIGRVATSAALIIGAACGGAPSGPPSGYYVTVSPDVLTVVQGDSSVALVTFTRTNDYTAPVAPAISTLPRGVTGRFEAQGTDSYKLITTAALDAATGVFAVLVNGVAADRKQSTPIDFVVSPRALIGGIDSVVSGFFHACALANDGSAYCWGGDALGQLAASSTETCVGGVSCNTLPRPVTGGLTFTSLSTRASHTCGITTNADAYCWGWNIYGQLGNGAVGTSSPPVPVAGGLKFAAISAGYAHTCGLTIQGAAYCWGSSTAAGDSGRLGDGTTAQRLVPTAVVGGLTFRSIAAGYFRTCALTTSGAAYCWGQGYGLVPRQVNGSLQFATLSAARYVCGLLPNAAAYCLGDTTTVPQAFLPGVNWARLDMGDTHSCAVSTFAEASCGGCNYDGELGTGSADGSPDACLVNGVPTPVASNISGVATGKHFRVVQPGGNTPGEMFSCGATTDGQVYCWGGNSQGQLGDGTTIQRSVPLPVGGPRASIRGGPLSQPSPRSLVSPGERRVGRAPGTFDHRIVRRSTVVRSRCLEELREQLVQFRTRDVEVRTIDPAAKRGAHHGDRFARAMLSAENLAQLIVRSRVAKRRRDDRRAQLAGRSRGVAGALGQETTNEVVKLRIAREQALASDDLNRIGECVRPQAITAGHEGGGG